MFSRLHPNVAFAIAHSWSISSREAKGLVAEEFKGVDVSQIAKLFNGGGHKLASGFKIDGSGKKSFLKIKEKLTESLTK